MPFLCPVPTRAPVRRSLVRRSRGPSCPYAFDGQGHGNSLNRIIGCAGPLLCVSPDCCENRKNRLRPGHIHPVCIEPTLPEGSIRMLIRPSGMPCVHTRCVPSHSLPPARRVLRDRAFTVEPPDAPPERRSTSGAISSRSDQLRGDQLPGRGAVMSSGRIQASNCSPSTSFKARAASRSDVPSAWAFLAMRAALS